MSSVLSKRWRDLWKTTGRLNFGNAQQYAIDRNCDHRELKRTDLMRSKVRTWVNHVVRLHECPCIEEFSLKFDLDKSAGQDIDEWIKFMIWKRVKTVNLDFLVCRVRGVYTISKECCDYIMSASSLTNIKNVRSLRLNCVNVHGRLVKYLLSNCPYLEVLSIRYSNALSDLTVVGPCLSLKYLECHSCKAVNSIKIEAPKLEKFVYYGRVVKFIIGSNPCLTELDLGSTLGQDVTYALVPFGSLLWQLETLTLRMHLDYRFGGLPSFGELSNLRHLMLDFRLDRDLRLYAFNRLIEKAPVMAKFRLMMGPTYITSKLGRDRETLVMEPPHRCLKEVEILGFKGGVADVGMAMYVLNIAVNLEKLVINPFNGRVRSRRDLPNLEEIDKEVKDLKKMLPLNARLIVVGCH